MLRDDYQVARTGEVATRGPSHRDARFDARTTVAVTPTKWLEIDGEGR